LLIMEFGGNITLENFLKEIASIEITDLSSLTRALQAYRAMLAFHYQTLVLNNKAKILHYDLHLANVLVTLEDDFVTNVKIIDYGKSERCDDFIKNIKESVSKIKSSSQLFNEAAFIYNRTYEDILRPNNIYTYLFIGDEYPPDTPPNNPVMKWIHQDIIKTIQRKSLRSIDDIEDHFNEFQIFIKMKLEDRLNKTYPHLVQDNELAEQAIKLPKRLLK
jgi:hypothetical protein